MGDDPRAHYDMSSVGPARGQQQLLIMIQVEVNDQKATKRSIAALYALCIAAFRLDDTTAWQAINGHLRGRFDFREMDAVKKLAWSIHDAVAAEVKRRGEAMAREAGHA